MNVTMIRNAMRCAIALTLLGAAVGAASEQSAVTTGKWGGDGIEITITASGARIQYDCAAGSVDEPIVVNRAGTFAARGTHAFGRGGPRNPGQPPPKRNPARYEGTLQGDVMQLKVSLPDLGRTVGEFTLRRGQRARLDRCG